MLPLQTDKTVIVIPCYNEEGRIPSDDIISFLRNNQDFSILLVNDGSTDATANTLAAIESASPDKIEILSLPCNSGKAEAVRQGILRAIELKAEFIAYLDADMSAPPEAILKLRKEALLHSEIKLFAGSRWLHLGSDIKRSAFRHYIGRIIATIISIHLHAPVYDTQCGAKLIRHDAAVKTCSRPFRTGWFFDVEIMRRIFNIWGHDAILEVALDKWHHKNASKVRFLPVIKQILKLLLSRD